MKPYKFSFSALILLLTFNHLIGQNPSALVEFESETQGVLFTRMSTTQREAIIDPVEGLIVYDLTEHQLFYYYDNQWIACGNNISKGNNQYHENRQPFLAVHFIIALDGIYPSRNGLTPFYGEISLFGGNFAPRGWAFCDGQLLYIDGNESLFSLLGTKFGGNGRTTFGLPDLRGRVPIHVGSGPGLSTYRLGEMGGAESVGLNIVHLPSHHHNN